ncbi:type I restriction endonuclease subunit R [Halomonas alkalisoli]|uniref:type I restriction endonuclease subunit R n=1 Tax=Halomonas alkalisoli TaxID=2907158 RepID=UPI001F446ACA|nr:type I restriction endonuclease subunit R [Halomonas alkalisoli]MCE9684438.1 type I restriction endonuclease subunit R [Halomonas alkalisoli]
MSPSPYSEDTLVQQTTADYLAQRLGWRSVLAWNQEDFGPSSLLGRGSEREVVLTRTLRERLAALNPGLPTEAYDDAVRQVVASPVAQSLAATNKDKYAQLRDGVWVTFRDAQSERCRERLRLIDFDEPDNNDFLCVRELWLQGDLYRRRADIIGFVNGLPLLFMECKNIGKHLRTAFEQNFSSYKSEVPHLFHHNALVVFGNGEKAKLGSLTSRWEHFTDWKRLAEEDPGSVDMETLLKGVCERRNFLDIVENFTLFDDSAGEPKKIIARNHQFLGVNRAVNAVRERRQRQGKLGVFWHTQGSGKSYSMVMFTRKVHRKLGGNFTFVVLTDREDLDTQIYKTYAGCGLVDNDRDPCRAGSGDHLEELLGQHKAYLFSLIQKFRPDMPPNRRDDIIVISDEAHRTQYGSLALNMRNALPQASVIGFTGTPLFKDDEITRRMFGDYVSTYDFQRAVEDKATVPLYYDARGDKLGVAIGDINERIAERLEQFETDDVDVEQRLERDLKRDYHIITAGKRLDRVAKDFVEHYANAWETGKAMLVCIDKITCVRMHKLIGFYWDAKVHELEKSLVRCTDEQEEQFRRRQLTWMRETRAAVVVSEEQGEEEKFRRWDLDITLHRRLMKEGIALPEAMRELPQFRHMQRMALDDAFKAEQHPFRIAIVCAMWLTGFDVPSLATLYLDKPLKAHTLMQTIARANRVNEGKNNGLIVDYCGILRHLRKALATFAGTTGEGDPGDGRDPARPEEELLADLDEAMAMVKAFLTEREVSLAAVQTASGFERNAAIVACKEAANESDESRKRFEVLCREVFKKFKACLNAKGVNVRRADRDAIDIVYKSLQQDREQADISHIIRELHGVVDEAIEIRTPSDGVRETGIYDISAIDFERLKKEFERSKQQRSLVQELSQVVEQKLQRLLMQNPLRADFQNHYEKLVADYNREKDRATVEQTFDGLLDEFSKLDEEAARAKREGLDEESLAIFDLLRKPDLSGAEIRRIKRVSAELLENLKARITEIDHWQERESSRDAVQIVIRDFLWDDHTGLPVDHYSEDEVLEKTSEVFRHVMRAYPRVPSPVYALQDDHRIAH